MQLFLIIVFVVWKRIPCSLLSALFILPKIILFDPKSWIFTMPLRRFQTSRTCLIWSLTFPLHHS